MTAYCILSQPDPASVDPQWIGDVGHLIDWVRRRYGRGPYFGAWAMDGRVLLQSMLAAVRGQDWQAIPRRWAAITSLLRGDERRAGTCRCISFSKLPSCFAADEWKDRMLRAGLRYRLDK